MNDRHEAIIERIKKELLEEGYEETLVFDKSETGPGDPSSFFEYLVDLKLEGKKLPSPEVLWTEFKKQLNHYQGLVRHAEKEYRIIFNKLKALEESKQDLIIENHDLKNKKKD